MASPLTKLIYVGDPMCSWCWGFAPEIERLAEDYPVEVVLGGLRPGPMAQELDDNLAGFLRSHWLEIEERTGQPFDTDFLDRRDGWTYDTEPAAIAITALRERDEPSALAYFTAIQEGFYAHGRDVTDFDVLAELAEPFEVGAGFREALETAEAKQTAWNDFSRARSWGISGFPTLVGELTGGRLALLARGWAQADVIRARITGLDEAIAG